MVTKHLHKKKLQICLVTRQHIQVKKVTESVKLGFAATTAFLLDQKLIKKMPVHHFKKGQMSLKFSTAFNTFYKL